jgi:hypothetical protein
MENPIESLLDKEKTEELPGSTTGRYKSAIENGDR